uniref:Uncharacterized protein n=1 Tax=Physcomitrium patens TaxID=3218 RepID=A0A2K1J1A9_PHYPA|nr:hypothetical protein PHYPA_023214 [Physcomitrium patens]
MGKLNRNEGCQKNQVNGLLNGAKFLHVRESVCLCWSCITHAQSPYQRPLHHHQFHPAWLSNLVSLRIKLQTLVRTSLLPYSRCLPRGFGGAGMCQQV